MNHLWLIASVLGVVIPNVSALPLYNVNGIISSFSRPELNNIVVLCVAGALLICSAVVALACVCCRNHGLKVLRNENGLSLPHHVGEANQFQGESLSEFAIFPPQSAIALRTKVPSREDQVTFEPLPEIRPRNTSVPSPSIHPLRPAHFGSTIVKGLSLHDWFDDALSSNFPRHQLQYLKELGSGWFGQVVEGEAQDIVPGNRKTRVVVKILREDATPSDHVHFLHEVRPFRDLRHPNILRLLGRCLENDPFLVILEYYSTDLKTFLIQHRSKSESLLQDGCLLRLACDIAAALQFMHERGFVHTDLAARNCLMSPEVTVKIGDYGTSIQSFKEDYYCLGDIALPVRWCAPETLYCTNTTIETKEVTREANIWSFGVLLWELLEFGKLPYMELGDDEVLQKVVVEKSLKLEQPKTPCVHKDRLYQVMMLCWGEVTDRPMIQKVAALLGHLYDNRDVPSDSAAFESRWHSLQPVHVEHILKSSSTTSMSNIQLRFESDFTPETYVGKDRNSLQSSSEHERSSFAGNPSPSGGSLCTDFETSLGSHFISPSLQNLRGSIEDLAEDDERQRAARFGSLEFKAGDTPIADAVSDHGSEMLLQSGAGKPISGALESEILASKEKGTGWNTDLFLETSTSSTANPFQNPADVAVPNSASLPVAKEESASDAASKGVQERCNESEVEDILGNIDGLSSQEPLSAEFSSIDKPRNIADFFKLTVIESEMSSDSDASQPHSLQGMFPNTKYEMKPSVPERVLKFPASKELEVEVVDLTAANMRGSDVLLKQTSFSDSHKTGNETVSDPLTSDISQNQMLKDVALSKDGSLSSKAADTVEVCIGAGELIDTVGDGIAEEGGASPRHTYCVDVSLRGSPPDLLSSVSLSSSASCSPGMFVNTLAAGSVDSVPAYGEGSGYSASAPVTNGSPPLCSPECTVNSVPTVLTNPMLAIPSVVVNDDSSQTNVDSCSGSSEFISPQEDLSTTTSCDALHNGDYQFVNSDQELLFNGQEGNSQPKAEEDLLSSVNINVNGAEYPLEECSSSEDNTTKFELVNGTLQNKAVTVHTAEAIPVLSNKLHNCNDDVQILSPVFSLQVEHFGSETVSNNVESTRREVAHELFHSSAANKYCINDFVHTSDHCPSLELGNDTISSITDDLSLPSLEYTMTGTSLELGIERKDLPKSPPVMLTQLEGNLYSKNTRFIVDKVEDPSKDLFCSVEPKIALHLDDSGGSKNHSVVLENLNEKTGNQPVKVDESYSKLSYDIEETPTNSLHSLGKCFTPKDHCRFNGISNVDGNMSGLLEGEELLKKNTSPFTEEFLPDDEGSVCTESAVPIQHRFDLTTVRPKSEHDTYYSQHDQPNSVSETVNGQSQFSNTDYVKSIRHDRLTENHRLKEEDLLFVDDFEAESERDHVLIDYQGTLNGLCPRFYLSPISEHDDSARYSISTTTEDKRSSLIFEDLETGEAELIPSSQHSDDLDDEVLIVDTETNEAILVDSNHTQCYLHDYLQERHGQPSMSHFASRLYTAGDKNLPEDITVAKVEGDRRSSAESIVDADFQSPASAVSTSSLPNVELIIDDESLADGDDNDAYRELAESKSELFDKTQSSDLSQSPVISPNLYYEVENTDTPEASPERSPLVLSPGCFSPKTEMTDFRERILNELIFESAEVSAGECSPITETRSPLIEVTDFDSVATVYNPPDYDEYQAGEAPFPPENCSFQRGSPSRDSYTPDFESDVDDTSSTGTSCSSTSGSFECLEEKTPSVDGARESGSVQEEDEGNAAEDAVDNEDRDGDIVLHSWDSGALPNRSSLLSPERKETKMKKSVSFHEEDPPKIYHYPKEYDSEEEYGVSYYDFEEDDGRNQVDYGWSLNYSDLNDWDFQPIYNDDEIPEDIIVIDEMDSDESPVPLQPHSLRNCNSIYSIAGTISEDDLDSLDSTINNMSNFLPHLMGTSSLDESDLLDQHVWKEVELQEPEAEFTQTVDNNPLIEAFVSPEHEINETETTVLKNSHNIEMLSNSNTDQSHTKTRDVFSNGICENEHNTSDQENLDNKGDLSNIDARLPVHEKITDDNSLKKDTNGICLVKRDEYDAWNESNTNGFNAFRSSPMDDDIALDFDVPSESSSSVPSPGDHLHQGKQVFSPNLELVLDRVKTTSPVNGFNFVADFESEDEVSSLSGNISSPSESDIPLQPEPLWHSVNNLSQQTTYPLIPKIIVDHADDEPSFADDDKCSPSTDEPVDTDDLEQENIFSDSDFEADKCTDGDTDACLFLHHKGDIRNEVIDSFDPYAVRKDLLSSENGNENEKNIVALDFDILLPSLTDDTNGKKRLVEWSDVTNETLRKNDSYGNRTLVCLSNETKVPIQAHIGHNGSKYMIIEGDTLEKTQDANSADNPFRAANANVTPDVNADIEAA